MILPLIFVTTIILLAQRRWHVASAWLLATGSVLGAVLALKLVGYACGWLFPVLGPDRLALFSPSGHAASAAVAYGGVAALLSAPGRAGTTWTPSAVGIATASGMAALIGATRLQLGAHTWAEVILAAGIGIAGAAVFARLAGRRTGSHSIIPVLAGTVVVVILFHGRHLPAERVIQQTAGDVLRRWITACQVNNSPLADAALPASRRRCGHLTVT